jgi:PAS domain S-box-containing protein
MDEADPPLPAEEMRLRARLVDQVQAALVVTDLAGRILYWNRHAEALYGWSPAEVLGADVVTLGIASRDPRIGAEIMARLAAGERWEGDLLAHRKDGSTVPVFVSESPMLDERGRLQARVGMSVDITVRRQAERRLATEHTVTRILSEASGIADAMPRVLAAVCETLEWPYGALWGVDRDSGVIRCVQTWHALDERIAPFEDMTRDLAFAAGVGLPGRVWASAEPAWLPDVLADANFPRAATAAEAGLRAGVCFPIPTGRDIVGVLEFFSHEIREPDPDLLLMMTSIGQQVGQFIERKRAEDYLARRIAELAAVNAELETFSYSVSHDLRAPLRSIDGFSQALLEDYGDRLDAEGRSMLERVRAASQRMGQLIDALLELAGVSRHELRRQRIDVSALAGELASALARSEPDRAVDFVIPDGLAVEGDAQLVRIVLQNLLDNAWKFTARHPRATIEVGMATAADGPRVYFVRDDGAGFDMKYGGQLFGAFQRLHTRAEFPGTGIGLATIKRIVHRHGGRVWAEGAVERGATFYFTLDPERS